MFLWFAFGLVLQPVTFRIDLPQTTIGNDFSILTNSNYFLCYYQDAGLSQMIILKHHLFSNHFIISFSLILLFPK